MKSNKKLIFIFLFFCSAYSFSQPGWFKLNSGINTELNGVYSIGQIAWVVGNNGTILRTTNSGLNWFVQQSGTTNNLNYILFRPDTVGFITGNAGTILRSTDLGNSWNLMSSGTTFDLNSIGILLFDTTTVVVAGSNGTILKSDNNGSSWMLKTSPVSNNLNSVLSSFPWEFLIVGDAGTVLRSYDLGNSWFPQSSGTSYNLRSLSDYRMWGSISVVMAVGDNGTIVRTTNSGLNWTPLLSNTDQNLRSLYATNVSSDSLNYFITVGANGTMLESVNGIDWTNRNIPFSIKLNRIQMQDMNNGYAVGSEGTILKSIGNYFYAEGIKLDANQISTVFRNDGGFNYNKDYAYTPGFEWPKGTGLYARFASGLCIGAIVNGDIRVAVSGYSNEYYPGYTGANSIPLGRSDTNYRIYKINYGSAGIDRSKWPNSLLGNSDQGAPVYFDSTSNSWKPIDFGSQTMFYSYTDSYPESHNYSMGGNTEPLGSDIKQINFSLDVPGALGNVIFSQYTIINRSNKVWDDAYFTIWSDDDLGDRYDDKIACDSALSLGYTYNADNNDPIYGSAPPAVGFVLLKGAYFHTGISSDTVKFCRNKSKTSLMGYRDKGMKVFNFAINGDINYSDPDDFTQTYNLMRGMHKDGSEIFHPSGYITSMVFSGDPVTGSSWIAANPNDYRMYISTGPVNVNPGDTQVIVTAQVIARGTSNLNSINALRQYVNELKLFYNSCYTSTPIGIISQSGPVKNFELKQNYPNPFNPVTLIKYSIPYESDVVIKVFNAIGQEVFSFNEHGQAGSYNINFDGSNMASGIYFYSIEATSKAGIFTDTKKMVLIK